MFRQFISQGCGKKDTANVPPIHLTRVRQKETLAAQVSERLMFPEFLQTEISIKGQCI